MTERNRTIVLFVWFVLYRLLCGYLLFPLAEQKLSAQAFHALRLCTLLVLLCLAAAVSMKYLFGQYRTGRGMSLRFILTALCGLVIVQLCTSALMKAAGSEAFAEQSSVSQYLRENPFGAVLSGVLIMPLFEELVFRVSLYELIRDKAGIKVAAVSANFIFGLSHVSASLFAGNGFSAGLCMMYFLCGMILQMLYLKTDYFSAVLTHSLFNLISMIV